MLDMNSILLLLLLAKFAASFSGCQRCASSSQCNEAFQNGAGKYCGSFYDISISDNKPCCCPPHAACKVTQTQCMCHVSNRPPPPPPINHQPSYDHAVRPSPPRDEYHEATSSRSRGLGAWPLLFILVLCGCGICYCRANDDRGGFSSEHVPVAKAVPASYHPSSENPAHHADNYGSTMMYGNPSGGGGGVGTAIASGVGGLAAGTLLGNLIGQNHAQASETQQFGGGYGGYDAAGDSGGGYDIAGDSGGGYDIAGDSGGYDGGGYDVAGDDGGGFDMAGDDGE